MTTDDYYAAFAAAPQEFFDEIATDEDLMDYAISVVDQWLENRLETSAIPDAMVEKVYDFLMSLGASMFVQGYAANSLRKRHEFAQLFKGMIPEAKEESSGEIEIPQEDDHA